MPPVNSMLCAKLKAATWLREIALFMVFGRQRAWDLDCLPCWWQSSEIVAVPRCQVGNLAAHNKPVERIAGAPDLITEHGLRLGSGT